MIRDYVRLARVDHWFKNVFMLPGIVLGWLVCRPANPISTLACVLIGVVSTCLVCSSNYTINEILDAVQDSKHPDKKFRPAAAGRIRSSMAYTQWVLLAIAGMGLAWIVGPEFFLAELFLFGMGIIYNVRPLRSKDIPYIDVLSESINNPLRLILGWYAVRCVLIPPASLMLSYWLLGTFFMAVKRFAELRHIGDKATAIAYRRSFAHYTEEQLLVSIVSYATASALFGGIFIIRYRVELILAVPVLAGFMGMYMRIGFLPNSPAQHPETLYKQKALTIYGLVTIIILIVCYVVRIPWLSRIFEPTIPIA